MRVFTGAAELRAAAGESLGSSDWLVVDQRRIDAFADATDDHQWIHVDPQRAAGGPFGTTIAHGLLTLSLLPVLVGGVYRIDGAAMKINYGFDRIRFPHPVPVGARIRAEVTLAEVTDVPDGVQLLAGVTVPIEGAPKPACVADWVTRAYF